MSDVLPTEEDVQRLLADPSPQTRRGLAEKLGRSYAMRLFRRRERAIADDIVRTIAEDVEIQVRQALAQAIASSPDLPEDVAVRLANDVIAVAEPILTQSDLLNDSVLAEIVAQRTEEHRLAIASRKRVSAPVSASIIRHGAATSVSRLVGNRGAEIAEAAMSDAVEKFTEESAVITPLAERDALPVAIAERLVSLVSDRLKERFAGKSARATRYADGLAAQMAEGAALLLGGGESEVLDLLALVDHLHATGKLQPSLVIRAGKAGEKELMHAAVSRLSGQKFSAVVSAFRNPDAARGLLAQIGLVPNEIDALLAT
jgi:uncharacterized protein (DUF2336 family)